MTVTMWVALAAIAALVIFTFGVLTGESFESDWSKQRRKRQAKREQWIRAWQRDIDAALREIDAMHQTSLDRVGEQEFVALKSRALNSAKRDAILHPAVTQTATPPESISASPAAD